jgi:hypothetical protein
MEKETAGKCLLIMAGLVEEKEGKGKEKKTPPPAKWGKAEEVNANGGKRCHSMTSRAAAMGGPLAKHSSHSAGQPAWKGKEKKKDEYVRCKQNRENYCQSNGPEPFFSELQ